MMHLTPIESSNIDAVGYDPSSQVLRVRFKNGGCYDYADVPAAAYTELMAAESKGQYLARAIKPLFTAAKRPAEEKSRDE